MKEKTIETVYQRDKDIQENNQQLVKK